MKYQDLINEVSRKHNLPYTQVEQIMNAWADSISACLAREEEADFGDLGRMCVKDKTYAYHPDYCGGRYVVFQPGKALRAHLQRR